MIAHIVLFNPKAGVDQPAILAFAQSLRACFQSVGAIRRVLVGRSVDVDPGYPRMFGDKTYRFAAVIEFDSEVDLVKYLNHPKHEELGRLFWEICESTTVSEHQMIDGMSPELDTFLLDTFRTQSRDQPKAG